MQRMLIVGAVLLAFVAAAYAQDPQSRLLQQVRFDQHLGRGIPTDAAFRDESGRPVHLGDYFHDRPVILALVYYRCPMLCTLTLNGLVSALKTLAFTAGQQFDVVVVSFDPSETPALAAAKKATYVQEYGRGNTGEGWHFLTGDADAVAALTQAVGFSYAYDAPHQQYAHATGITVLTPDAHIARYFFGVEFAPRDLRLGLVEVSHNRIGGPVDQLLLFCLHYDPTTGKYNALTMNLMRAGGALTLLLLGGFMLIMFRRDRAA